MALDSHAAVAATDMSGSSPPDGPRRTLRLLFDGASSSDGSGGGLQRLSVQAASVEELHAAVRAVVKGKGGPLQLELYDPLQERFGPLPTDFSALPSLLRLRVQQTTHNATTADGRSGEEGATPLALPWRRFPVDLETEGFPVAGRRLVVRGVENSGQGTGLTTWDGAVVLAKYLEHAYRDGIGGKRVLETGAGTGLVGLACAALGAGEVLLTDLSYTISNLEANVRRNEAALEGSGARVRVLEGDWFKPPAAAGEQDNDAALGPVDLVVAADVVWLDELVAPLAGYLRAVLDRPGSRHSEALMSYQTRSSRTEALLLEELGKEGLSVERIDPAEHHPEYRADGVLHIFRIRLLQP